ncbi:YhfZ family protein [Kribbella turkmenica]|nr:YhfZ family protein [Kribbella turkmenica]
MPPVQELQDLIGAGAGTVVKALRQLQSAEAVGLDSRGRSGTVITSRHVGRLWEYAGLGNLHVAMPPPGPLEQQAIAAVLQEGLARLGIPMVVDFGSGSRDRLAAVFHERAQVAVTSLAAFHHHSKDMGGLIPLDLGTGTYYAPDSLVIVERAESSKNAGPRRVGIDNRSFDHEQLTHAEFDPLTPEYVDCAFYRAPAAVLAGDIDAAVWHELPTVIPPRLAGLRLRRLGPEAIERTAGITNAALITRALDAPVNAAIRTVRIAEVAPRQRALAAQDASHGDGPAFWPR